jgi:hypothetical protein
MSDAHVTDRGELPFDGAIAIWHPVDDIHQAPRFTFGARPRIEALYVGEELTGYVLRVPGEVAEWRPLGDAGTDGDRFFLVRVADIEPVVRWFNELLLDFERLGGDELTSVVTHEGGTTMVVIQSPDGNAVLRGGFSSTDELVALEIRT